MKKDNNLSDVLKNLTLISQIGLSIITPILLGVFLGRLLDNWIGTSSIFMILFIIIGTGAGFLNLFKLTGAFRSKRK